MKKKEFIIEGDVLDSYIGNKKTVVIPQGIKEIGISAFSNSDVQNVILPNTIEKIGYGAFAFCRSLKKMNLPKSIKEIDKFAFRGCKKLKKIIIPNTIEKINGNAFWQCETFSLLAMDEGKICAYKAFRRDWSSKHDFIYTIGETYHIDDEIRCGSRGFHACLNPLSVFNYYCGTIDNIHFAEVELSGVLDVDKDKIAASDIKIVREISVSELADIYNKMVKGYETKTHKKRIMQTNKR